MASFLRFESGKHLMSFAAALWLGLSVSHADFFFAPDVPTRLGGVDYAPWSIIRRSDAGIYSMALALPAGTPIDGLYRLSTGTWLLSVEAPTTLGGITFDRRDVIRFDGVSAYALFFGGAAAGIPAASNVDALFLDGGDTGDLVLSFDIPTMIAGVTYEPADLVRFAGGVFSLLFDASAVTPPIPISANVTGAGRRGPRTFLTFDVLTTLGGTTYLPGQIVAWDGTGLSTFFSDPGWQAGTRINALSLGACLDGDGDGYGLPGDAACASGGSEDCDDTSATVFPGAAQLCNGINDDCSDPAWPAVPANEANADADGFRICSGDCLDTDSSVYPGAPQLCDGVNNDCTDPSWPAVAANEADADGDGVRICGNDCNDADSSAWATPGEVSDVAFDAGGPILTWTIPLPGGTAASMVFDVIRSPLKNDYVSTPPATCVESDAGPDTTATDVDVPAVGTGFFYLVRAQNSCPGAAGVGPLGMTSGGVARSARDCP